MIELNEIDWVQTLENPKLDINHVENLIDSWILEINHVKPNIIFIKIINFLKAMRNHGHLARLNKEYKGKYYKIRDFVEKTWSACSLRRNNV